ncbi:epoxide hydrolase [Saccharomycopsis crataegensis]|uniref:Epoxide hydrolase n=1 Tax=Saccharomycopsis crataegensis TaxID=43959 RepID=A0AAV5QJ16_9ASCO|nr:epoxide hydrolase [Saccharomycopsis crataegensis]
MSTIVNKVNVKDGSRIFYREAGSSEKQTVLLLHGYPTSSYMFRNLMPLLSGKFHVVAPDLPGFGFTEPAAGYHYTFDNIAASIQSFTEELHLKNYIIYIFDYGAPTGLRLALMNPNKVKGFIVQNGNAYKEGLNEKFWGPIKQLWDTGPDASPELTNAIKQFIKNPKNVEDQYYIGMKDKNSVDPLPIVADVALIRKPGQIQTQFDLFYDYRKNVELYPKFHEFFRSHNHLPMLIVWGNNDYIFTREGAEAYKRDFQGINVKYYEAGHFALETHATEIAEDILNCF